MRLRRNWIVVPEGGCEVDLLSFLSLSSGRKGNRIKVLKLYVQREVLLFIYERIEVTETKGNRDLIGRTEKQVVFVTKD